MLPEDVLICEVCRKNEAVGVAASVLGPCSLAYCHNCLAFSADALFLVEATLEVCGGPQAMAPWVWEMRTYREGSYLSLAQLYGRQKTMDLI